MKRKRPGCERDRAPVGCSSSEGGAEVEPVARGDGSATRVGWRHQLRLR
jgi:hypothetical protein